MKLFGPLFGTTRYRTFPPVGSSLTAAAVIEYVASKIARYKQPKWVTFTPSLPRTADGQVDREAVKATWEQVH